MTQNSTHYLQGYRDALRNMDEHITNEIGRNGGGQTPLQILNVFNSLLARLHKEISETEYQINADYIPQEVSKMVEEVLDQLQ